MDGGSNLARLGFFSKLEVMKVMNWIILKIVLTYHISATHDGWDGLSLNWCRFLIFIPLNNTAYKV